MSKYFLLSLSLLLHVTAGAQKKDSLYVAVREDRFFIRHLFRKNETVLSVAGNYKVPAVVLSQNNEMALQEIPKPGKPVYIPLGNYNFLKKEPLDHTGALPLYYKVAKGDRLSDIARYDAVTEEMLRDWNKITDDAKMPQIMFVGWVVYNPGSNSDVLDPRNGGKADIVGTLPTGQVAGSTGTAAQEADTTEVPSRLEQMYDYQTNNGESVTTISGTVVFYTAQTTVSSTMLYAFSNDLPKGKVVKITNTSNGKSAFVRVLGPLPNTRQYYNAKIGVDSRAKTELGIRDNKLWCELSYGGGQ